jgi:pyruvate,water dikinase
MIVPFSELTSEQSVLAGGKGSTLAKLRQAGYPVPGGFVFLIDSFDGDELKPGLWEQAAAYLARMRKMHPGCRFAVRSSALAEDSAAASFAGEFDTVLDVAGDDEVRQAVATVHKSRHNARVQAYSKSQGLANEHDLAVVVQLLIPAKLSGVLFTADPLSGSRTHMVGNFVFGLGEKLVSGETSAEGFKLARPYGKYTGSPALKKFGRQLFKMADRLEKELGGPQDIEWAVADGKLFLLQSRPVTSLRAYNPATGERNDSFLADFVWSNGNGAEIQPGVVTLLTGSVGDFWGHGYSESPTICGYPWSGNIGGRIYFNLTVQASPFAALPGMKLSKILEILGAWWGNIPEGVTVPLIPVGLGELVEILMAFPRSNARMAKDRPNIPGFVAENPAWCHETLAKVRAALDAAALSALWRDEILPRYCLGTYYASIPNADLIVKVEAALAKLVGAEDARAIVSSLAGRDDPLESLGPLLGLEKITKGEMTREEYLQRYGHRCPYEFEISHPRPSEDPKWLDRELAGYAKNPTDVSALLQTNRERAEAAWTRFCSRYPGRAPKIRADLDQAAGLARLREAARSEATRIMAVVRAFALRAGEFTGLGDDIFMLTVPELLDLLAGKDGVVRYVPARRATYERYCALPPYPTVISGRFDPFKWAADPERRSDVFDSHVGRPLTAPTGKVLRGVGGASGVVEGRVRRLDHFEQGAALEPGEILVTNTTNVGWTPLFPRAAAVVTDVGALLSHAAIVARELGLPAVVGCGDATARLKTGDRVRVDGARGTVEIL